MKEKSTKRSLDLFGKSNYTWMMIGAVLIIGGMLLMAGGKAPLLIVAGFIVEIYALFKKA